MTLYRGIVKGRERQLKTQGTGMWFTDSLLVAKTYSNTIEVWELDEDQDIEGIQIDCLQRSWSEVNTDGYARKYKDKDVIIFKDIVDVGPLVLNYAKKDNRTVKENFKDFTASTIVVNSKDCIQKIKTINVQEEQKLKESESVYPRFEKSTIESWMGTKCCMCKKGPRSNSEIFETIIVNKTTTLYFCPSCSRVFRAEMDASDFGTEDWNALTNF